MADEEKPLGRRVLAEEESDTGLLESVSEGANTRTSLWPVRWPAIALQVCIDEVEAAEPARQLEVKRSLPCQDCPERARCLNAKRLELGGLLYDREILTRPRSQESSLFPRELFVPMLVSGYGFLPQFRKPLGLESELVVVSAWDLAWSEKVGGDWLVKMTAVLDRRTNKRRLIDVKRWQGLRFTQQSALMESEHRKYNDDVVIVEGDAAQQIWTQTLQERTSMPVQTHYAGSKRDFEVGVPSLLIDIESRRWELPYRSSDGTRDAIDSLLAEFEAFGWVAGKLQGVGEHDDQVMCFWHLTYGLRLISGGLGDQHRGIVQGKRE